MLIFRTRGLGSGVRVGNRQKFLDLRLLVVSSESETEQSRHKRTRATRCVDIQIIVNRHLSASELIEKFLAGGDVIYAENLCHHTVVDNDVVLRYELVKNLFTLLDDRLLDFSQLLSQTCLGLGRGKKRHPFRLRRLGMRGQNLNLIAGIEPVGKRHKLMVDLSGYTPEAELRV